MYIYVCICIGGIIVEPPTCGSNETGAVFGIGQETAYLDSDTESFQICCRVQGPPGYTVSWLRDDSLITNRHSGYELGDDHLRYVGILRHGCVKYTCRVDFSTTTTEETTQICIGGKYKCSPHGHSVNDILSLSLCVCVCVCAYRYHSANSCKHYWRTECFRRHHSKLPMFC